MDTQVLVIWGLILATIVVVFWVGMMIVVFRRMFKMWKEIDRPSWTNRRF